MDDSVLKAINVQGKVSIIREPEISPQSTIGDLSKYLKHLLFTDIRY